MSGAIRFPTADELQREFDAYEMEMARRRRNPLPEEPREVAPETPRTVDDLVFCQACGKRFDYATRGMALMQRSKHMKRDHADVAEAY